MPSPYRVDAEKRDDPNSELVYLAGGRERHAAPARTAVQLGIVGAVGAAIAASAGHPQIGLGIMVGAALLGVWTWRRSPDVSGLLLRVEQGELTITKRGTSGERGVLARVRLVELRDVSLDTKSIRKVEPGRDVVPAVQFINSNVGPEIDVARIVLETGSFENRRTIRLTDAFLSHMDSVEWAGKIRSFLRSHGWVPDDEREPVEDEEADDEQQGDPEKARVRVTDYTAPPETDAENEEEDDEAQTTEEGGRSRRTP